MHKLDEQTIKTLQSINPSLSLAQILALIQALISILGPLFAPPAPAGK